MDTEQIIRIIMTVVFLLILAAAAIVLIVGSYDMHSRTDNAEQDTPEQE